MNSIDQSDWDRQVSWMRSVGHVARMIGKPEGKKHHKDIGVVEKIILNSILKSIMV